MKKVLPIFLMFFLFSGCSIPENKKISLVDGVYVGEYPHRSPFFVFTSWGHGYIIPDSLMLNNTSIDSIISFKKEYLYPFETDEDLIDTRYSLLHFDGKYALATFKGDFQQSSYCFLLSHLNNNVDLFDIVDPECVNFYLRGYVRDYPTITEQIKALFLNKKSMSPDWREVYNTIANSLEKKDNSTWLKLRFMRHRPRRTTFANNATITIDEPVLYTNPSYPDERLLFDRSLLDYYKYNVLFDYRINTYAFILKGFINMGEGDVLFVGSNGKLTSYQPHIDFSLNPSPCQLLPLSYAYIEPIRRGYNTTIHDVRGLFLSLVSTLDEYFQQFDPEFFENIKKERERFIDSGKYYE